MKLNENLKLEIKNEIINELNGSQIFIDKDAIRFKKNNKLIFIYDRKNDELIVSLYPVGDLLMNKYSLNKIEFSKIIENIITFQL
jgi:hypothetical protein